MGWWGGETWGELTSKHLRLSQVMHEIQWTRVKESVGPNYLFILGRTAEWVLQ